MVPEKDAKKISNILPKEEQPANQSFTISLSLSQSVTWSLNDQVTHPKSKLHVISLQLISENALAQP